MPALYAYSNVENTALIILTEKGYRLWRDLESDLYYAEKDGWDFCAAGAVELLGVIGIYEYHNPKECQEYWWRIERPWLLDSLPKQAPSYTPVWEKK
jgi:hypothetical protein